MSLALAVAVAVRAWHKGRDGLPEWSFWKNAASADGLDGLHGMLFGYLPGVIAYLRPFFWLPEPAGLALFIAVGLTAATTCLVVLRRELGPTVVRGWWVPVWLSAPLYLGLQNNQLVAPMFVLVLAGVAALAHRREIPGGLLLAAAALIKLPALVLAPWLLLRRRVRALVAFGLCAATVSVLAATAYYGPRLAVELHASWPGGVLSEDPARALSGPAPASFRNNQSAAAWIVRAAPWIGDTPAWFLRYALFWGSLALVVAVELHRRDPVWVSAARWLAWSALAGPFARYYYCLQLLPAWWILARRAPGKPAWAVWTARLLPVLAWTARSDGAYPLLTAATFLLAIGDRSIFSCADGENERGENSQSGTDLFSRAQTVRTSEEKIGENRSVP